MKKKASMAGLILLIFGSLAFTLQEEPVLKLGLLKYNGGGDWYSNPTALPNLARFCNGQLGTDFSLDYAVVEVGSAELFNYPFVHMTGHGNVLFSDAEAENLRNYLIAGGFLHIDDNYGLDPYVRVAMKKVFPDQEFIELPFEHPIYHQKYSFKGGLPKIHKHDDKNAQGFGLFWEDRLVCFYTYESDLGDGWEDPEVHKDPPDVRRKALQMGANIIRFAFQQQEGIGLMINWEKVAALLPSQVWAILDVLADIQPKYTNQVEDDRGTQSDEGGIDEVQPYSRSSYANLFGQIIANTKS